MDFWRQRGFPLDGEYSPEKAGFRKESHFVEFMYVARDFVGVVFHVLYCAKGSHSHCGCCCFEFPQMLNLDFPVYVFVKLSRGFG